jgi:rare lipoprotein A
MHRRIAQYLTMALLVGWGAAQDPAKSKLQPVSYPAVAVTQHHQAAQAKPYEVGTASWYGEDFDGKPTASGEPYNMYDLTAAHPSLPLGTLVKVTNLRNRRSVVVRINDRGPVVPGRIIDLSYGAASTLKFKAQGIQRVRLDVVPPSKVPTTMALLRTPAF